MATTAEPSERVNHTERSPLLNGDSRPSSITSDNEVDGRAVEAQKNLEPEELPFKKLVLIMSFVYLALFFAALDNTIIATLAGPISSDFESFSLIGWIASSYIIASAAIQPASGKLTDIFGRRNGLVFCETLFCLGCIICGLARSAWVLILGRVVSGVGGGGMFSVTMFILNDLIPLRRRGLWQGFGNCIYGVAICLGGVLGGSLNDHFNWRWAFFFQVPFIIISTVFSAILIKIPTRDGGKDRLKRIDFIGSFLLETFLVLLLLGIDLGGNHLGWMHWAVLTILPVSALILVVFIWFEANVAVEPVIPINLMMNRTVFLSCLLGLLGIMGALSTTYYVPLYFQAQGMSATQAGLRLIPQAVGTSVSSIGSGWLLKKTGRYYTTLVCSLVVYVIGNFLYTTMSFGQSSRIVFLYMVINGLGFGTLLTVSYTSLIAAVEHKDHALVTGASMAFRQVGGSMGVTVVSSVFQFVLKNQLWARLGDKPDAAKIIDEIRDNLKEINRVPSSWKADVLESYEISFRAVFYTVFIISLLSLLVSTFLKEYKLHNNLARR